MKGTGKCTLITQCKNFLDMSDWMISWAIFEGMRSECPRGVKCRLGFKCWITNQKREMY